MSDIGHYRRQSAAIGTITPSANLVVERVTTAILADFPHVSGHFSRAPVHGASQVLVDSYDWDAFLGAAQLLAHAQPGVICWNGSRGGSIAFAIDHELCRRVSAATGIPATTSTVALEAVLRATGVARVGLVTPYAQTYQRQVMDVFAREGVPVVAEAGSGLTDNFSYAAVPDDEIVAMMRTVAATKPDAIVAYCTNFPAAHLVDAMERALGIPVYDSVSIGVWHALRKLGIATAPGRRWGSLFGRDDIG
jgi:maleate isomerase